MEKDNSKLTKKKLESSKKLKWIRVRKMIATSQAIFHNLMKKGV